MSEEIDDLFGDAVEQTNNLEKKKTRDPRLIDLSTPNKVKREIYFRMFIDGSKSKDKESDDFRKPILFLPYKEYSFISRKTGKPIYAGISPEVFGEDDYFQNRQYEMWDVSHDAAKLMYPNEKRVFNIYVIKDTFKEENNGQFLVMKQGAKPVTERAKSGSPLMKCIHKLFNDPDRDDDVGRADLYKLDENGITLRMTITGSDDIPDVEIDALPKGKKIQGFKGFSEDEAKDAYFNKSSDLYEFISKPLDEEALETLIQVHLLKKDVKKGNENSGAPANYFADDDDDDGDDIPDFTDSDDSDDSDTPADETKAPSKSKGSKTKDDELDDLLGNM